MTVILDILQLLKRTYDPLVWRAEQPISGVTFSDDAVLQVRVKVGQEWTDIGNRWQWKYASPPVVSNFVSRPYSPPPLGLETRLSGS